MGNLSSLNILFITPYTPNLIRVRPYQLLRALLRRGHRLTLAALWSTAEERANLAQLEADGMCVIARHLPPWRSALNCAVTLPTGAPLQSAFCWQPSLAAAVREALAREAFDVVHVEHLRGARYGLDALTQRGTARRPAIVWDSVDCISHLFQQAAQASRSPQARLMTRLELDRTRRHEDWLVHQFDSVLVTSDIDRRALLALAGQGSTGQQDADKKQVVVVPNGVDLSYFAPGNEPRAEATLVFSGKMSYHANVTAATFLIEQIMPHVWHHRPDVRVQIVGKDPPPLLARLAARLSPRVQVTGTVPDVRPYLRRATLAVAPVPYGAGIQNKVLEAMACGTPVVATQQAVSALALRPELDIAVADNAPAFARCVLDLLASPERRDRLGQAGRAYVTRCHHWDYIAQLVEATYQQAAARTSEGEDRAAGRRFLSPRPAEAPTPSLPG